MARRATKAVAADTDPHGTAKPTPDGLTATGPYPGLYGHPDVTYCPLCGHYAIGRMAHGEHPKGKS